MTVVDIDRDGLCGTRLVMQVGDALVLEGDEDFIVQEGASGEVFIEGAAGFFPKDVRTHRLHQQTRRARTWFLELIAPSARGFNRFIEEAADVLAPLRPPPTR